MPATERRRAYAVHYFRNPDSTRLWPRPSQRSYRGGLFRTLEDAEVMVRTGSMTSHAYPSPPHSYVITLVSVPYDTILTGDPRCHNCDRTYRTQDEADGCDCDEEYRDYDYEDDDDEDRYGREAEDHWETIANLTGALGALDEMAGDPDVYALTGR